MQITDTHVQFWNPDQFVYPWLKHYPALNRAVLPSDLPKSGVGWAIEQVVAVESEGLPENWQPEVEWYTQLSRQDARIRGIVAFVPLENHNFHAMLAILGRMPLVKGVRRKLDKFRTGFLFEETFLDTVRNLADYNFSLDVDARVDQSMEVLNMVKTSPEVTFALNSLSYPDGPPADDTPWLSAIKRLSEFDNVTCKLSVLHAGDAVEGDSLTTRQDALLDGFAPNRLMYSSHFPHSFTDSQLYSGWVSDVTGWLSGLSAVEQESIFYRNGVQFYQLSET